MRLALSFALAAAFAAGALAADDGFKPLFDGQSLDGWKLIGGHGEGYLVRDGKMVLPAGGGGNLFYADQEFSDFVLRFEFKLEPGSNNGLCIRCPMQQGSLAYDGMELQIIDNDAERYKNIQPWQKHGSLYNVFPARTGALKPAGEWNEEEVTVDGRRVRVVVNGETILDANLDAVTDEELLAKHPGLERESGYIAFLGHDEPIEFRNIRIRELTK